MRTDFLLLGMALLLELLRSKTHNLLIVGKGKYLDNISRIIVVTVMTSIMGP